MYGVQWAVQQRGVQASAGQVRGGTRPLGTAWLLTHAACLAAREQGQGGALTTLSTPSSI